MVAARTSTASILGTGWVGLLSGRIEPARKDRPVAFALPKLADAVSLSCAVGRQPGPRGLKLV